MSAVPSWARSVFGGVLPYCGTVHFVLTDTGHGWGRHSSDFAREDSPWCGWPWTDDDATETFTQPSAGKLWRGKSSHLRMVPNMGPCPHSLWPCVPPVWFLGMLQVMGASPTAARATARAVSSLGAKPSKAKSLWAQAQLVLCDRGPMGW